MSVDDLVEKANDAVSRRSLLQRAAAGAVAAVLAMLGLPSTALATFTCKCCTLCKPCRTTTCAPCASTWNWICVDGSGKTWGCFECHGDTSYCGAGCSNVTCSWYEPGPTLAPAHG